MINPFISPIRWRLTPAIVLVLALFALGVDKSSAQSQKLSDLPPSASRIASTLLTRDVSPLAAPAASWQRKLDPAARLVSGQINTLGKTGRANSDLSSYAVDIDFRGQVMMDVLIELEPGSSMAAVSALEQFGVRPGTQVGNVLTARLPADALQTVAEHPSVRFVELARRRPRMNEAARADTKADLVHQGTGLPQAYRGNGVIVGVIDSGIDFTHPDFSNDEGTRIRYLLEYTEGGGQKEWTKAQIDANPAAVTQRDGNGGGGHGTHVTATAAGGGRVNANMSGVAPEAEIIFVKGIRNAESLGGFSDADVVNGIQYIFEKADELGLPAVVNLSLGAVSGPLDGSTLYEQVISDLTGPGRIVVAAAGNSGYDFIHAGGTLEAGQTHATIFEAFNADFAMLEMWYAPNSVSEVGLALFAIENNQLVLKNQTDWVPVGQVLGADQQGQYAPVPMTSNEQIVGYVAIDAFTTQDQRNGDGQVVFYIDTNGDQNADISRGIWMVLAKSTAPGRMDLWANGGQFFSGILGFEDVREIPGNTDQTVGSPASALGTIAVGSYVTGNAWTDIDGSQRQWQNPNPDHNPQGGNVVPTIGQHSYFSSKGPLRDGRTAPDIAAPGELIFSAMSSHLTENDGYDRALVLNGGSYLGMQGTSMATPHATGVVALMLEADPTLDPAKVRQILSETARADAHTGTLPNNKFGAGKIDAQAAVLQTLELAGTGAAVAQLNVQSLAIEVRPDEVAGTTFQLDNVGGATLSFSASATLESGPGKASIGETASVASSPKTTMAPRGPVKYAAALPRMMSDKRLLRHTGKTTGSGFSRLNASEGVAGEDLLYIDDGNPMPDNFIGFGDGSEFYWANQFDLGVDFELDMIHFYMRTEGLISAQVWLAVYDGEGNELVSGVVPATLSVVGTWYSAPISTPISFNSGDTFFLEVGIAGVNFPAGADVSAVVPGKSFYYYPDIEDYVELSTIQGFEDGAFLIRAGGTIGGGGPANQSPVAVANLSTTSVGVGESITFDGSGSTDPDGEIVSYAWTFGDGASSSEPVANHAYGEPGTYNYSLTVTDNEGAIGQTSGTVTVTTGPPRFTVDPASGTISGGGAQNITVTFDATGLAEGTYIGTLTLQTNGGNFNLPINILVAQNVASEEDPAMPRRFALHQNYPNPFNPTTSIRFDLPNASEITLHVYDLLGRRVAVLYDGETLSAGSHETRLDATGWSSGVYLYRLAAGPFSQTRYLTVLK